MDTDSGGSTYRIAVGVPLALLLGVWLLSVACVGVGLVATAVVDQSPQLLWLEISAGLQAGFAVVAGIRVRKSSNPFRSGWTLAVAVLAIPLFIANVATMLPLSAALLDHH